MAALEPKFTDQFLVGDKNNNYGDFIRMVRKNVIDQDECHDRRSDGIDQPVLPLEDPKITIPKLWFHIILQITKASSITLAIRMENLYLVGFKTHAGVWWELDPDKKKKKKEHLIKDAKWLGFGGRYQDRIIGEKGLETVKLGRREMAAAVDFLAKYDPNNVLEEELQQGMLEEEELIQGAKADPYAKPKIMLAKLVIMICEGLRFFDVSDTVDRGFDNQAPPTVTQMEGKRAKKWDQISNAVFVWAQNPNAQIPAMVQLGINSKVDAAKIVALVKDQQ